MHLHEALAAEVESWRRDGYPHEDYPAIEEILRWAGDPEGAGFRLRPPQLRALETYWYLRLVRSTPHVVDLYSSLFPQTSELLEALGLTSDDLRTQVLDHGLEAVLERVRRDDEFVRAARLEALRETLTLAYPSYILALAMGAGKTVLIGAIFASEFAMALEDPEGPFVQNALVFAPGKTILESLRQLAETPFERILPPRLYKAFAASVKLTFTRDGDKDIPVIRRSVFNVIVTNTEKIRIQREQIRKADLGGLFAPGKEDEARAEIANLRLQAIASLPRLAVFSDEAHHTYGQALDSGLKKVRKTVDYLAASTEVVCVVNTTGTPYYRRQPLRDVVIWYGLSQGIRDNILKEVAGNIQAYDFEGNAEAYAAHVVEDFFRDYGAVSLADGTPAKLAMYFPQTDDVEALRPAIEARLAALGLPPTLILEHHTRHEQKTAFDRFRFADSPHRIALLVDRGVEGWDVPGLFACALVRRLKTSNNFVLQAASRCLRQVPGNAHRARIYLSTENRGILDRQLQETYGETIADLDRAGARSCSCIIRLRKLDMPPLVVRQRIRSVVPRQATARGPLRLEPPPDPETPALRRTTLTLGERAATYRVLEQIGETLDITEVPQVMDLYAAAVELGAVHRLDLWDVRDALVPIYRSGTVPLAHLHGLSRQIEAQVSEYEVLEEDVEVALALVRPEGFRREVDARGWEVFTAEIVYPIDRENRLLAWEAMQGRNPGDFGFHYTPYNFDSTSELSFFEQLLGEVNMHPDQVEDIYFTGALTSPEKTDFYVRYLGEDGRWHAYTPDFLIRRKDGRCLIVEIKDARFEEIVAQDLAREARGDALLHVEGRKAAALRRWQALNPERLRYEILFATDGAIAHDQSRPARDFVSGADRP